MRNRFIVHEDPPFIEWRIGGRVTRDEIIAGWSEMLALPGWSYSLNMLAVIDFDARLSAITLDDIQAFQAHVESLRPEMSAPTGARTAIVALRPEHWSLLQLHNMSFADKTLSEDEVFDKEDEAREWLSQDKNRQTI